VDEHQPARRRTRDPRPLARHDFKLACRLFVVALLGFATAGCNQGAIESWLSEGNRGPSLYGEKQFAQAMTELKKHIPAPIEALSLLVYPNLIVLQARDPNVATNVSQFVYRDGVVSDPVAVKLLGTGKLDDNLFPLDAAKVDAIPRLAKKAQVKANIPEGSVARVLLKRNLPDSTDIEFRIFVSSERRDAVFVADQSGNFVE
jgi:hypothetical protein